VRPPDAAPAATETPGTARVVLGDSLQVADTLPDAGFALVYLDPPFNTGHAQTRAPMTAVADPSGTRTGFRGTRYRVDRGATLAWNDRTEDYLGFLGPRLRAAHRLLTPTGSLFVHLDAHEVHYVKVFLDGLFGRACFQNEIIWAYDYGGRSRRRWAAKHDTILWYTRDPERYTFRHEDIDRVPYMAPGLVGPEKARRGKLPTDTWWHTIVPPGSAARTGWPTQKPRAILDRIVRVHSNPGEHVLDLFAGSGTTGEAAARAGRHAVLVDCAPEAVRIMRDRLGPWLVP
jgi:site-specific DNA-methyltransferase (adenine-specific)